uniref:Movement protein n=1 Tax=Tomato blistering mosaic virus TaxID=1010616 RepID=A0A109RXP6_9VIRU|nr:movement protein [Tomato blistering mosaic virus]
MSNVFSSSLRRPQLDISQRCGHQPYPELCGHSSSGVSHHLSMAPSKRSRSLPPGIRNSQLWFGNHSSSPSNSQSNRDFSPLQSLELSGFPAFNSDVHEAFKVFETSGSKSQLLPSLQLSSHLSGHSPLSRDFPLLSSYTKRLHARRFDVLLPLSDPGPVSEISRNNVPLCESGCSTRIRLHRSLSLPSHLSVLNHRLNPPLHSGRSPRRSVQSTNPCSRLVENSLHPLFPAKPLSNQAGLLGPRPLPPNSTGSASKSPKPKSKFRPSGRSRNTLPSKPLSKVEKKQALSNHPHPECSFRSFPSSDQCRCPGLLQSPGLSRASSSHISSTTPPPPSSTTSSVQRALHLHKSRSHSQNLRPSRFCSHSKQQTRIQLGHSKRMGQSPNVRSDERPHPTQSVLRVLSQPIPEIETPLSSTLAKIPYPFFPCPFDFGSFSSSLELKVPHSRTISGVCLPASAETSKLTPSQTPISSRQTSNRNSTSKLVKQLPVSPPPSSSILGPYCSHKTRHQVGSSSTPTGSPESQNHSSTSRPYPILPLCRPSDLRKSPSPTNPRHIPHQPSSRTVLPVLVSSPIPSQLPGSLSTIPSSPRHIEPSTKSTKALSHSSDSSSYDSCSSHSESSKRVRRGQVFLSSALNRLTKTMLNHPCYYSSGSSSS